MSKINNQQQNQALSLKQIGLSRAFLLSEMREEKVMRVNIKKLLILSMSLIAAGCGGSAYKDENSTTSTNSSTGSTGSPFLAGGLTNTTTTTTSDPSFVPALSFSFNLAGTGSTNTSYSTPGVNTDNRLRVRVTALQAGAVSLRSGSPYTYSNFTANYSCIKFTVKVFGQSKTTQALRVPGSTSSDCPETAVESQVLNFDAALGPGHGPVVVTVENPLYDFYCKLFKNGTIWGSENFYCPMRTVYQTHTVNAALDVEVNGTTL